MVVMQPQFTRVEEPTLLCNQVTQTLISHQPRCERNHRSRAAPCSLILYSNVPLPVERLSSKPKLHNLLKYVQADRAGVKLSLSATSFGPSDSPWVAANKDRTCSSSSLYRFICLPRAFSCVIKS